MFPPFLVDASAASRRVILRRGVTGSLDLYRWWDMARGDDRGEARTIRVQLMTPDLSRPVMTWSFHGARPIALSYAPLNALAPAVLIESIEVEFDHFEMH